MTPEDREKTRALLKETIEQVKANTERLNNCTGSHHIFARIDPSTLFSKWRCTVCDGEVDTHGAHWYQKGLDHGRKEKKA